MALDGMDLEVIQPLIPQLNNAVNELQSIITSTSNAYSTIEGHWNGKDADQFHSQWPSFTSALNQAHNDLTQLHTHLQSNYNAQQQASNSY